MQAEETEAVPGERKRSCVRVVKAGGSFFDDPDFPRRLRRWIDQQPPALNLVIFGGGPLVDSMRELDQRFQFGAAWVHWTCIDLLAITWQMACKLLPEWDMCPTKARLDLLLESYRGSTSSCSNVLVHVDCFYRSVGISGCEAERGCASLNAGALPENWLTTTDALAGLLAKQVQADEVVLLKSCEVPAALDLDALAEAGIIDPVAPGWLRQVPKWRICRA